MNSLTCHVASNTMTKSRKIKKNKGRQDVRNQLSTASVAAPLASSTVHRQIRSPPVRLTGTQALAPSLSGTALGNSRWHVYPISTFMASSTGWLYSMSINYSRFKFTKFVARWVPMCSVNVSGHYAIGIGYDMSDFFPQSAGGININGTNVGTDYTGDTMSLYPSVSAPFWNASEISVPTERFTTNKVASAADFNAGVTTVVESATRNWFSDGYVLLVNSFNTNVDPMGRIVIDYEVELIDPIPASFNA